MSTSPQGTVAPQARPLALLSRRELGEEFRVAARYAMGERRRTAHPARIKWWCHPMVEAVLDEIELRFLEECSFEELQLCLFDAMSPRK